MTDTMATPAQPLTGQEWSEACDRIEDLWPGTKTYTKAERLFEVFRDWPADLLGQAITALFNEGRQGAPSPSKIMSEIRRIAAERGVVYEGPHECALGHVRPFYRYGGLFAAERGPGETRCSIADCEVIRPCHCPEECKRDSYYSREVRPANTEELALQLEKRGKK